ncbi:MAG: hypothetical protein GX607_08850 [Myxococcales bacterium]|jgi:hypothetical protein|nr:hypothetical protein [Myxococcales bacterium]
MDLVDPSGSAKEPVRVGASDRGDPERTDVRALTGDVRAVRAWRQWLESMATDAESVLAAAIAYRDLDAEGRERWLDSLAADAPNVNVPRVALYAPLIAVECDPIRRRRLLAALEGQEGDEEYSAARPRGRAEALTGRDGAGVRVSVVVLPLYLDFVQVLACGHDHRGFVWVRHEPVLLLTRAPRPGDVLQGARIERTPLKSAVDLLAAAVLAHRRSGRALPDALKVLADLLDPSELQ